MAHILDGQDTLIFVRIQFQKPPLAAKTTDMGDVPPFPLNSSEGFSCPQNAF